MENQKLCDGLEISVSNDIEYIIAYRRESESGSGITMKCNGLNMMALTSTMVCSELEEMRDPHIQASFFAALFEMVKNEKLLNPIVDVAVSYDGRVLRNE